MPAFLKATVLAAGLLVLAPAAQAAPCGGLNQPVCKKFPNPAKAQCGQWLHNVRGTCRPCGARNQQACPVLAKGPVCRPGLERRGGTCVTARDDLKDRMLADARQRARRLKPLIDGMAAFARSFGRGKTARLKAAVKARNAGTVRTEVIGDPRAFAMKRLMLRFGFNTMTVGIESSASLVGGAMRETGASMDLHERAGAKLYVTNSVFGGVIANVGNDIAISAWSARNGAIDGPAWGALGSFDVGTGVGITIGTRSGRSSRSASRSTSASAMSARAAPSSTPPPGSARRTATSSAARRVSIPARGCCCRRWRQRRARAGSARACI